MPIPPKSFYIKSWILAYLTRYPYSYASQIIGAQTQYSEVEITHMLNELVETGWAIEDCQRRGYRAAEPLVMV